MVRKQIFSAPNKPSLDNFNPIRNRNPANRKPMGGFWTSPGDRNELSGFEKYESGSLIEKGSRSWLLYPKNDTKVMKVESEDKLHKLPSVEGSYGRKSYIDFERVFDENHIDGIYFSRDLVYRKAFSDSYNLYAWDVECIIWNNINWIQDIELLGETKERISQLI